MASKFQIGQSVIVKPAHEQSLSLRDSSIEPYIGKTGKITDYYSISPNAREAFYIYTVQLNGPRKKVVLHEDEIDASS